MHWLFSKRTAILCCLLIAHFVGAARCETLELAWSVALAHNHRLAAAQLEQLAASEDALAARAERYPTLALRSAYTARSAEPSFVIEDPLPGLGTFEFPYAQQNAASAGAIARLPIYTSGRIKNSVFSAAARRAAAECEAASARLDLIYAVGEAYFAVLRCQSDVDVAEREHESLTAHARDVERQLALEQVAHAELLAAQAAAAAANQRRLHQLRNLEYCRARYNRLLGRALLSPVQLKEVELQLPAWTLDQLIQLAHQHRPDIQALVAVADSHRFSSNATRAGTAPQVCVSLSSQYDENRYGDPQTVSAAAVIVDWNLYDGGKANRSAEAQLARASAAHRMVEDLRSQIALDLLDAWNQYIAAAEMIEVASRSLEQTAENLRVARERFSRGMAVDTEVLEADAKWTKSLRDYHHALYDRSFARLRLSYTAGLL